MAFIRPDAYYIRNRDGNRYIGLNETNHVSAFQGQGNPPIWTVTRTSDGQFILVVDKKEAASSDGNIIGVDSVGTRWKIQSHDGYPRNVYTIENATSRSTGWVLNHDADLVKDRPLIVYPSFPPRYPDIELWEFEEAPEST
ncbi:hypothetical protein BDQ12DRAFT_756877 [Crucibulum laeve]|uniref:Ricin B lectin domain-containing protein n=1 Tax=Crucibulum laeve TaxID=68775 RepID=A0A5C3LGF8_9AGAR|nr:hypothetical protein BDQ12DRAFT_765616 [Crucibulum laeve]TFK35896.1 hypothetical protein BDQ12DRAFT_756877 [Crucibulum laeve]